MWRRCVERQAWSVTGTECIRRGQHWPGVWTGRAILGLILLVGIGSLSAAWGQLPGRPARRPAVPSPANAAPAASLPPSRPPKVSLEHNRLSVQAQDSDLHALLETIATQAQIEVRHLDSLADLRVSVDFTTLPMVDGLKRILRAAGVAGYALVTTPSGDEEQVRRLVFLKSAEGTEGTRRATAAAIPGPAGARRPPPPPQPAQENRPVQQEPPQEDESEDQQASVTVFEDLKANATARRLLNQLIHPNEQVRERALEGLVRLIREDDKQRDLLEFLEPLMEDLAAEDKDTQEEAREEIRQLLR